MEQIEKRAKLIGIDGVYIPVSNRKQSEEWYVEHLGVEQSGDYCLQANKKFFYVSD